MDCSTGAKVALHHIVGEISKSARFVLAGDDFGTAVEAISVNTSGTSVSACTKCVNAIGELLEKGVSDRCCIGAVCSDKALGGALKEDGVKKCEELCTNSCEEGITSGAMRLAMIAPTIVGFLVFPAIAMA